jgi:hypothetical protein
MHGTVHISKQKQLIPHGKYSKTANWKKNYRDILWIFRIVCGMYRRFAVSSFPEKCFREKAQLQALENTTQPLWVGGWTEYKTV